MLRILFDTNVLIQREDYKIIDKDLETLMNMMSRLGARIIIHPRSLDDIEKDKNIERKNVMQSKLKTYNILSESPTIDEKSEIYEYIGAPKNDNDFVDDNLLNAVYKNFVNFLITEDIGIHRKAKKLSISERVLTILDSINLLIKYLPKEKIRLPPSLNEILMAELDIRDPIFDTLKKDYSNFEEWFKEKSMEGRKGWAYFKEDKSLGAILFYKLENEPIASIPPIKKIKRLKISTMKVSQIGFKIGELLIKLVIKLGIQNDCEEIYLTHFTEEKDYLIDLISEYGFNRIAFLKGDNDREEYVYTKQLFIEKSIVNEEIIKQPSLIYPYYVDENNKKFIVPIRPEFHERLFPDFPSRQRKISEYTGTFIIEGNTIKKAYLSHANTKKVRSGDLLLFYKSKNERAVVTLGVVESIYYGLKEPESIANIVGKRTVYTYDEIENISKKPTLVILFLHILHLGSILNFEILKKMQILKTPPQTITEIEHKSYLLIKKRGRIDERFALN